MDLAFLIEKEFFHSGFGKACLDPRFNLITQLLQRGLHYTLSKSRHALVLLSDLVLQEARYRFKPVVNSY